MATILIADDDPVLREIAAQMLRSTDHAALMAEDGLEVLRLLEVTHIDLLVTDMLMPNMDGVELIVAARARYPDLRVLAISSGGAVGTPLILQTAKMLGADATLLKPLNFKSFTDTIADLLESQLPERFAKAN